MTESFQDQRMEDTYQVTSQVQYLRRQSQKFTAIHTH